MGHPIVGNVLDRSVSASIAIAAPAASVWRALTTPELMAEWMSIGEPLTVESDWVVGGPIVLSGTLAGHRYADEGTILRLEPERALAYSHWSRFSRLPDRPENRTVVELVLSPGAAGTTVSVTHRNLTSDDVVGHVNFYWPGALRRLRDLDERT